MEYGLEEWLSLKEEVSRALKFGKLDVNVKIRTLVWDLYKHCDLHRDTIVDLITLYIVKNRVMDKHDSRISSRGLFIAGVALNWLRTEFRRRMKDKCRLVYEHELPTFTDKSGEELPALLEEFIHIDYNSGGSVVSMPSIGGYCDTECFGHPSNSPEYKVLVKEKRKLIDIYLSKDDQAVLSGEKTADEVSRQQGVHRTTYKRRLDQKVELLKMKLGN